MSKPKKCCMPSERNFRICFRHKKCLHHPAMIGLRALFLAWTELSLGITCFQCYAYFLVHSHFLRENCPAIQRLHTHYQYFTILTIHVQHHLSAYQPFSVTRYRGNIICNITYAVPKNMSLKVFFAPS